MFEKAFKRLLLVLLPLFFIGLAFLLVFLEESRRSSSFVIKPQDKDCDLLLGVSPFTKKSIKQIAKQATTQPEKKSIKQLAKKTAKQSGEKEASTLKPLSKFENTALEASDSLDRTFRFGESYFLSKQELLRSLKSVEALPKDQVFFVLPLVLNKEEEWMISEKVFFFLPSKERKEISHLTYEEILDFQKQSKLEASKDTLQTGNSEASKDKLQTKNSKSSKDKLQIRNSESSKDKLQNSTPLPKSSNSDDVLSLNTALSYMPKNSHFLFRLLGSHREKIIKNLDKVLSKNKGECLYLFRQSKASE